MKRFIAQNDIHFYTIDGIKIGKELGLGGRINTILQAAFFKIANIIPIEQAVEFMKAAATKSYRLTAVWMALSRFRCLRAGRMLPTPRLRR